MLPARLQIESPPGNELFSLEEEAVKQLVALSDADLLLDAGQETIQTSLIVLEGPFIFTDAIPRSLAPALLYISLLPIVCPFAAVNTK